MTTLHWAKLGWSSELWISTWGRCFDSQSHLFFQHFIEIEICMNKTIIHFVSMEHILFLASFLLPPITDNRSRWWEEGTCQTSWCPAQVRPGETDKWCETRCEAEPKWDRSVVMNVMIYGICGVAWTCPQPAQPPSTSLLQFSLKYNYV